MVAAIYLHIYILQHVNRGLHAPIQYRWKSLKPDQILYNENKGHNPTFLKQNILTVIFLKYIIMINCTLTFEH